MTLDLIQVFALVTVCTAIGAAIGHSVTLITFTRRYSYGIRRQHQLEYAERIGLDSPQCFDAAQNLDGERPSDAYRQRLSPLVGWESCESVPNEARPPLDTSRVSAEVTRSVRPF